MIPKPGLRESTENMLIDVLLRLGRLFAESANLCEIAQFITDSAVELTDATSGAFFDQYGKKLYASSSANVAAPVLWGTKRVMHHDPAELKEQNKRGDYMAVPILSLDESERLACLVLRHSQPGGFQEHHESILLAIAAQTDIGMANRKLLETAEKQKRARDICLSNTPDFVYVFDCDNRCVYANDALLKTWGLTQSQTIGKNWHELGYEQWHADMHTEEINRVIATKQPLKGEIPFTGTNGRRIYEYILVPVTSIDGTVEAVAGTTRDVTERKEMEERLQKNEERLSLALETSPFVGTWMWDIQKDIVTSDESFARLFDVDPELARTGAPLEAFLKGIHPEDRDKVEINIRHTMETGEPYAVDYRVIAQDGEIHWLKVHGRCHSDAEGNPSRFPGIAVDITEERLAAQAMQASEARLRFLTDMEEATRDKSDPYEIMEIATRMTAQHMNTSRCAYADVEKDGDHFTIRHDYVADHSGSTRGHYSLQLFGNSAVRAMQSGQVYVVRDLAKEVPQENGGAMFNLIGVKAIICYPLVKDGALKAMMAVHHNQPRDWTADEIRLIQQVAERSWAHIERVRYEAKLRDSEERFRELADAMPQVVWTAQADGHLDYINQRCYDYSGVQETDDELMGWSFIIHPEDKQHTFKTWMNSVVSGEPYEVHQRIYHAESDSFRWNLTRALPVRNESGYITKWYGTNTDIEDQKRIEVEMSEARNAAEAANIAKSEFLANMSHEIRTPMNAVIGLANILARSKPLSAPQSEYIKTLQTSAESLLALINDLLDIAKIESRSMELEKISFSIGEMVRDVVHMMSVRSKEKGLSLEFKDETAPGKMHIGDPTRVRQIVMNLCSNAIKFTEQGSVTVTLSAVPMNDEYGDHVTLEVKDTGIGILPEKVTAIFDKFIQADNSINRKYGGTGLGLAITKTLVEMMGGKLSLESIPGKGSTFTVALPLEISANKEKGISAESSFEDKGQIMIDAQTPRVLLVEDYAANVLVATTYLEMFGYACDVASNGLEAIEKVKNNDYLVVLMDVQMHGMNGLDATRIIREYEAHHNVPRTYIIGMTAHALAGDSEKCLSAGMDDYLPKPFNPDELQEKLQTLADEKNKSSS